ncbi:hypothetical protein [Streptomyces sp. NPDC020983]|uniref:hypothetical protein n=1 Tax=Streptomyces sp. NPDC020983 TaxID=3365106 RepID=UPI00378A1F00
MASKTGFPANWTPTGTAWRTASGQLVQIYRQGTGGWGWGCGGCLDNGDYSLSGEKDPQMLGGAQAHANGCSAIQV